MNLVPSQPGYLEIYEFIAVVVIVVVVVAAAAVVVALS